MVLWRHQLRRPLIKKVPEAAADLEMLDQGTKLDSDGFGALLRQCSNDSVGRRIHGHMIRCGYAGDRFLENLLMEMYGKCGCLEEAKDCFARICSPNEYSWTILISAFAQNGRMDQALQFFSSMALSGIRANDYTFVAAINACAKMGSVKSGKKLHDLLLAAGDDSSCGVLVGNALIHMYGKCRELEAARASFERMTKKDVVSWNSIISAYAQNGRGKEALELYKEMDWKPDKITYVGAMEACASIQDLKEGRTIHARINEGGIQSDTVLENTILNMYGKCRSLEDAKAVFDRMGDSRSFVSWNIMILAYAQNGFVKEALEMFQRMDLEGVEGDAVSFSSALEACASAKAFKFGKAIHDSIRYCDPRNVHLDNALTSFYGRCGCPNDARMIFDQMPMRDVVSWTAMISVYVESGFPREALGLYRTMCLEGGRPNDVTVKTALEACGDLRSLKDGREVHSCISWEEETGPNVGNSLMIMYSKCGDVEQARNVFDNLRRRDLFSWTLMIRACGQSGRDKEAVDLFFELVAGEEIQPDKVAFSIALHSCASVGSLSDGKAIHQVLLSCIDEVRLDVVVCNTLMIMYARCGSLAEARNVFESMIARNTISWNSMITSYAQKGKLDEALAMFKRLQAENQVKPDRVTFLVAIDCCASKLDLEEGRRIHSSAAGCGLDSENVVGNTLVNMYGKCGQVSAARGVFDKLRERDVISWTSLLASYASNGYGEEGLEVFRMMQQDYTQPNEVTFLGVLFACSHLGLLRECKGYLVSMQQDYGLKPSQDHLSCVIDLLGRSGKVDEAEELVNCLPFEPDSVTLTSLLGACRNQGDLRRGIRAAESVLQLQEDVQGPYLLLWKMAATGL